jgi:glycosyltransferase involved in cell wall biosynthesis
MTICFIHPHKAFLPEVAAYTGFFSRHGITTQVIKPEAARHTHCDVEWHFMGHHTRRNPRAITIHEYASASVPPFSTLKNTVKKIINARPDYRLFNNHYVLEQFHWRDGVPFGIRQYGIPSGTAHLLPNQPKQYDFVYVGTLDKSRRPEILLDRFTQGDLAGHSLLVISGNYQHISATYAGARNILFTGPIPYNEMYAHIQQARFGINYMPDVAPYNRQTSYKFIDYAACRLPIVTSDYKWVRDFQQQFGGRYFYLDAALSNLSWKNVTGFDYAPPQLHSWTWEMQLRQSGVLDFLEGKLGLKFGA